MYSLVLGSRGSTSATRLVPAARAATAGTAPAPNAINAPAGAAETRATSATAARLRRVRCRRRVAPIGSLGLRGVLISWSPDAAGAAERLQALAEEVEVVAPRGPPELKTLAADLPDAVVIDLDRRPSDGLVIGIQLRRQPATRHTPQVFAGGEPDKVERLRAILHDARYADWDGVGAILRTAIERPPSDPVRAR